MDHERTDAGTAVDATIDELADGLAEELVAFRRDLHMHPEASFEEHRTTAQVVERLAKSGLEPQLLTTCDTGLVCDVGRTDGTGPLTALRADLDALPMQDEKDVPYRSRVPGFSHACGHDAHTTIVLGAGLVLAEVFDRWGGDVDAGVRLVFEPGEEMVPGGAVDVIAEGHVDAVDHVFGLHCDPTTNLGKIGVRTGALTSAADMVDIWLRGPGGHTARPHLTVDLVRVTAKVVAELPGALAERAAPYGDLRLVFGAVEAGGPSNVIPTLATLRGSLRTPDRAAWEVAVSALEAALNDVVEPTGATWDFDHVRGIPPVVNDPDATEVLSAAAQDVVGPDGVVEAFRSWGADSFAWYGENRRTSYARLGVHDPSSAGRRVDLHAGTFDIDERALVIGVKLLVRAALRTTLARRA